MGLASFLLTIVGISLSGVMAPGPITVATLAAAARRRHAGAWICAGHVAVELPLILVLAGGLGAMLASPGVRAAIGLVGGLVLAWMGTQLLLDLRRADEAPPPGADRHPIWIGVALSGANPYFLLWWATVGLALTSQALELGIAALVLFALLHWVCDLVWLEVLSLVGHKGATLGRRTRTAISLVCAAMLLGFGAMFVWDAAGQMNLNGRLPQRPRAEGPSHPEATVAAEVASHTKAGVAAEIAPRTGATKASSRTRETIEQSSEVPDAVSSGASSAARAAAPEVVAAVPPRHRLFALEFRR